MITPDIAVLITESGGEGRREEKNNFMWFLYCKPCCTGSAQPNGKTFSGIPLL
jgi:hypothetical protein